MARVENCEGEKETVEVGDYVCFKYDIEQCSEIFSIRGNELEIDVTEGGYQHGRMFVRAADCWIE